jgi:hypothetical protein
MSAAAPNPGGGIKVLWRASEGRPQEGPERQKVFLREVERSRVVPGRIKPRVEALIRKSVGLFDRTPRSRNGTKEAVIAFYSSNEPGYFADYIAQSVYEAEKSS